MWEEGPKVDNQPKPTTYGASNPLLQWSPVASDC
jgi:hypothetical protein